MDQGDEGYLNQVESREKSLRQIIREAKTCLEMIGSERNLNVDLAFEQIRIKLRKPIYLSSQLSRPLPEERNTSLSLPPPELIK